MPTGHREPPGFSDFVAARGASLVRTATLLTHDHAAAEDRHAHGEDRRRLGAELEG
ncbi:hypothetical protein [Flexivirga caeni]|uniref:hypothetical protein n=1 Tax=Flexivirga caeni TaxID=2294115 RepID=UPI0013157CD6|nr:hypothetical protein [Flexivirga caeni]